MLAKRECKKIQGPSGEVYRLKIFWGKGTRIIHVLVSVNKLTNNLTRRFRGHKAAQVKGFAESE